MCTVDCLYSPDGIHPVRRQHFPHSRLAIQGPSGHEAARRKHKNQSVLVQELHVQAQAPSPLGLKLPGSDSTALHIPSPRSHPPPFSFFLFFFLIFLSGWTTRHMGSVPRPGTESTPCPQHWKHRALITGPPGKSLEDSSLCHLLMSRLGPASSQHPGRAFSICTPSPRCPQPQQRGAHTPTSPADKPCHMGPIPGQMGTEALQKIRDKS